MNEAKKRSSHLTLDSILKLKAEAETDETE